MSRPLHSGYRDMSNRSDRPTTSQASRAERFEDEKRRLVESCFSKLDAHGQPIESYITHIRMQEDAQYPAMPPPPDSPQSNKKPRVIIVAVRSTGRVRIHKARENNNGSFSIGKTWNMEDLSAIESFNPAPGPPRDEREQQQREWAGELGFTVTIIKPYYWQAVTAKEKIFFIASTIKIYKKYTKGQLPELRGFDDSTKAWLTGVSQQSLPSHIHQHSQRSYQSQQSQQSQPGQPSHQNIPQAMPLGNQRVGSGALSQNVAQMPAQMPAPLPPSQDSGRAEHRTRQLPAVAGVSDPRGPGYSRTNSGQQVPNQEILPRRSREEHPRPGVVQQSSFGQPGPVQPPPFSQSGLLPPSVPQHSIPLQHSVSSQSVPQQHSASPMHGVAQQHGVPQHNLHPMEKTQQNLQYNGPQPNAPPQFNLPVQQTTPPPNNVPLQHNVPQHGLGLPQSIASHPQSQSPGSAGRLSAETEQPRPRSPRYQQEASLSQPGRVSSESTGSQPQLASQLHAATRQRWMPPPQQQQRQVSPLQTQPQTNSLGITDGAPNLHAAGPAAVSPAVYQPSPIDETPISTISDPPKPLAPERGNLRPSLELASPDVDSPSELKPAPLYSGPTEQPVSTKEEAPRPIDGQRRPSHAVGSRPSQESPHPKQLDALSMPGGFAATPQPTPGVTPGATPPEERGNPLDEAQEQVTPVEEGGDYRPGLGPMFKKDNTRNRFQKVAATAKAANLFKPRPGGAAEKILKAKAEREAAEASGKTLETEGVSGFVPRPGTAVGNDVSKQVDVVPETHSAPESANQTPAPDAQPTPVELKETLPETPAPVEQLAEEKDLFEEADAKKAKAKIRRRSNYQERNITALGVDPSLLEGRCLEFEAMLADFGWNDSSKKSIENIEAGLRREQARLEAGSWLSQTDAQREEKVSTVEALLDKAIQECDDLDGLLTLYHVELSSLNEDIAFIEAQSQGLQVQSANQKLLHNELQNLVNTISLDQNVFDPLRHGDLGSDGGLSEVEGSLGRLYQAMSTINPGLRGKNKVNEVSDELSHMRAVREKRDIYARESAHFCQRFMHFLDAEFANSFAEAKKNAMRVSSAAPSAPRKLNVDAFTLARRSLWVYGPEVLFMKELTPPAWETSLRKYHARAQPVYKEAFGETIVGWRQSARKQGNEDAEAVLFTTQEKDDAGSASLAVAASRKLTVKKTHHLKNVRNASGGHGKSFAEGRMTGHLMSSEAFAGAMDEMAPLVLQEQSFIVQLFHASSLGPRDFLELIQNNPPEQRQGMDLLAAGAVDPDRDMASRVTEVMTEIFGFLAQEMGSMIDWSVSTDPIQCAGIMACLSKHRYFLTERYPAQQFLIQVFDSLTARLHKLWTRFIDEQVRAIEETKVKIKKRKGVIGFMKAFPHFSVAVEGTFASVAGDDYNGAESVGEVRQLVDEAYTRLNRAMFDSLRVIAKESPSGTQTRQSGVPSGEDAEDKEMLNFHVLLIENMNHYIEEVENTNSAVLAEWKDRAKAERLEALEGYTSKVLRRPLGRLMDFLDQVTTLLPTHTSNPRSIASRPSTSRKAARTILSSYDVKEIRDGIEKLRRRIEKHFGHADEEILSKNLVAFVEKECERGYERVLDKVERVIREVYPPTEGEKDVVCAFGRGDVQAGFRGR